MRFELTIMRDYLWRAGHTFACTERLPCGGWAVYLWRWIVYLEWPDYYRQQLLARVEEDRANWGAGQ